MADEKELNPSPKFPSGTYPELSPNPDFHDGLVDKTDEKANTQVSPTLKGEDKPYIFDKVANFVKSLQIKGQPLDQYLNDYINQGAITKIEVTNVKQLTDEEIDKLECGDVVVKKTGNQRHNYIVTYKENGVGICLSYFDASCIETQSYDYTAGHWVYNSEDKTSFADIGGLPEVSALDNGKVLEVLSGVWGKGGKKVNVIDAPSSTTLDDDTIAKICDGIFVNGDFLNLHNPILIPFGEPFNNVGYGFIIGNQVAGAGSGRTGKISIYSMNLGTKKIGIQRDFLLSRIDEYGFYLNEIKVLNGKIIPDYPANTGTFTLKCVNGNLTWVQDV